MKTIAYIRNDLTSKFGVPRQPGLVPELISRIVFEPPYRVAEALRGLEGYSHLWVIWRFHRAEREDWSPTVRPPRLGGNTRVGVFATRSPFRPNPIGLSVVKLEGIREDAKLGPTLLISGADMMDGTPVLDLKPYLPYADCVPGAAGGFTQTVEKPTLTVDCPDGLLARVPLEKRAALLGVLRQDPRPAYQHDPDRVYGFGFGGLEVRFRVAAGRLTVTDITREEREEKEKEHEHP